MNTKIHDEQIIKNLKTRLKNNGFEHLSVMGFVGVFRRRGRTLPLAPAFTSHLDHYCSFLFVRRALTLACPSPHVFSTQWPE